jgi:hypothetical protein
VHWIHIDTKAERHELTSKESHFTKHNPSLCSSSICSQKMLEEGFAFSIFIMRATARRLPISICVRQTRVRDRGSVSRCCAFVVFLGEPHVVGVFLGEPPDPGDRWELLRVLQATLVSRASRREAIVVGSELKTLHQAAGAFAAAKAFRAVLQPDSTL